MAITRLTTEEFLSLTREHPVLDVRSPGEFSHAHIPGANNLPLFTDEERKMVGTAYKQESQQKAIKLGLEFFGAKMVKMVEEVEEICKVQNTKHEVQTEEGPKPRSSNSILVHCWRGGMRSAGVAWLLDLYGYKVYTLIGGYKSYRKWVLAQFEKEYPMRIIGGYTGSGKTEVLQVLAQKGENIIDLEALANHKGSAFGSLGLPDQPSQEMFENLLAKKLEETEDKWQAPDNRKTTSDNSPLSFASAHLPSPIWLEDESQRIGHINIPNSFFRQMRAAKLYFLNIPFDERLQFIISWYGHFEKEKLVNAIIRIKKRLGGLETKTAINHLLEDNMGGCFAVLLHYYDKYYLKSLNNRENLSAQLHKIETGEVSDEANAAKLLALIQHEPVSNPASSE